MSSDRERGIELRMRRILRGEIPKRSFGQTFKNRFTFQSRKSGKNAAVENQMRDKDSNAYRRAYAIAEKEFQQMVMTEARKLEDEKAEMEKELATIFKAYKATPKRKNGRHTAEQIKISRDYYLLKTRIENKEHMIGKYYSMYLPEGENANTGLEPPVNVNRELRELNEAGGLDSLFQAAPASPKNVFDELGDRGTNARLPPLGPVKFAPPPNNTWERAWAANLDSIGPTDNEKTAKYYKEREDFAKKYPGLTNVNAVDGGRRRTKRSGKRRA